MSAMISSTTFLHSSLVICAALGDKPLNNQRGIYPEHAEGVVQDRVHFRGLPRLIQNQPGQGTLRIELIDVDRGMNHQVIERRQISRQLESPGGTHRMPDVAFGI